MLRSAKRVPAIGTTEPIHFTADRDCVVGETITGAAGGTKMKDGYIIEKRL